MSCPQGNSFSLPQVVIIPNLLNEMLTGQTNFGTPRFGQFHKYLSSTHMCKALCWVLEKRDTGICNNRKVNIHSYYAVGQLPSEIDLWVLT